jgi:hypothetical protein
MTSTDSRLAMRDYYFGVSRRLQEGVENVQKVIDRDATQPASLYRIYARP